MPDYTKILVSPYGFLEESGNEFGVTAEMW
jgi:hypothetical protein